MALAILLTDWGAATGKQIDPSLTLVTTSTSLPFFESLMKPPPPPFEPRRARVTVKHPRSYWGTGAGAQGRSSIGDKAGCPRGKRCKIVAWGAGVRVQGELTGDVAYVTATSADSFAAVRVDGTVQSWSHSRATATYPLGQVLAPPAVQRVLTIATTDDAFAVIMAPGGSVIAWGHQVKTKKRHKIAQTLLSRLFFLSSFRVLIELTQRLLHENRIMVEVMFQRS